MIWSHFFLTFDVVSFLSWICLLCTFPLMARPWRDFFGISRIFRGQWFIDNLWAKRMLDEFCELFWACLFLSKWAWGMKRPSQWCGASSSHWPVYTANHVFDWATATLKMYESEPHKTLYCTPRCNKRQGCTIRMQAEGIYNPFITSIYGAIPGS